MTGTAPLVLDFDGSVLPLADDEIRLDLRDRQEDIRFGTGKRGWARLEGHLRQNMPAAYGCVFLGSGDFHHLSLFLLRHLAATRNLPAGSLDVVVCDNHPDNMRYVFGLHCGSWVRHAALLDVVRHVHVVGITSPDIAAPRAWENYLGPFVRNKLTYWSIGVHAGWLKLLARGANARSHASAGEMLGALLPVLRELGDIYLSVDKDVLAPDEVRTNWDQGVLRARHLERIIAACAGRIRGADVCGDASAYYYRSFLKRFLNGLDARNADFSECEINGARQAHRRINATLAALVRPPAHSQGAES